MKLSEFTKITSVRHPSKIQTKKLATTTDDWSNIPFYPDRVKRKEIEQQYGKQKADEIIEYSYNHSVDPNIPVIPPHIQKSNQTQIHQKSLGFFAGINSVIIILVFSIEITVF